MKKKKGNDIISNNIFDSNINDFFAFSNAYIKPNVIVETQTETLIKSKNLRLVFTDTKEIDVTDFLPGSVKTKTFTVSNESEMKQTYNIKAHDIVNTYDNDVVYTLK